MAIKVNGTTVIDDSRNIASVGTVTATSFTGSGANLTDIAAAPFAPAWEPTDTPDQTFTSTGTFTKPGSVTADTWVVFYMVGGGASSQGGGSWRSGGSGGNAMIWAATGEYLPSSFTITIGAGGVPTSSSDSQTRAGGATSITLGGNIIQAKGGSVSGSTDMAFNPTIGGILLPYNGDGEFLLDPTNQTGQAPTQGGGACATPTSAPYRSTGSVYGGGGGGASWQDVTNATIIAGGTSTYAGDGGNGASGQQAGGVPGGGAGGYYQPGNAAHVGAAGSCRIYYSNT